MAGRKRCLRSLVAVAVLMTAVVQASRASKVVPEPVPQSTVAGTPRSLDFGAVPEPESGTLDRIKREGEAVLTGTHWTYDAAGRRDPFRSLLENMAIKGEGQRPPGIAGMLISEVDLVGIINGPAGSIAFLNGSDNRGYFMRNGNELYDGKVMDIDRAAGRVLFRQRIDDPREIKPYRDVIKKLYSSTEEGR